MEKEIMKIKPDSGLCRMCDTACEYWGFCPHTTPHEALDFMYDDADEVDEEELRKRLNLLGHSANRERRNEIIAKYYMEKRNKS